VQNKPEALPEILQTLTAVKAIFKKQPDNRVRYFSRYRREMYSTLIYMEK
jgi:hypothetical protein